jgi:hypothetical protein
MGRAPSTAKAPIVASQSRGTRDDAFGARRAMKRTTIKSSSATDPSPEGRPFSCHAETEDQAKKSQRAARATDSRMLPPTVNRLSFPRAGNGRAAPFRTAAEVSGVTEPISRAPWLPTPVDRMVRPSSSGSRRFGQCDFGGKRSPRRLCGFRRSLLVVACGRVEPRSGRGQGGQCNGHADEKRQRQDSGRQYRPRVPESRPKSAATRPGDP